MSLHSQPPNSRRSKYTGRPDRATISAAAAGATAIAQVISARRRGDSSSRGSVCRCASRLNSGENAWRVPKISRTWTKETATNSQPCQLSGEPKVTQRALHDAGIEGVQGEAADQQHGQGQAWSAAGGPPAGTAARRPGRPCPRTGCPAATPAHAPPPGPGRRQRRGPSSGCAAPSGGPSPGSLRLATLSQIWERVGGLPPG